MTIRLLIGGLAGIFIAVSTLAACSEHPLGDSDIAAQEVGEYAGE